MAQDPNTVENAVSRTLRDNLEKIQHSAEELHQAVSDLVAACASSRPSNALPPMVRAQTSAASLSATLEVLSRFVTGALQPAMRMPFEPEVFRVPSMMGVPPAPLPEQPLPPSMQERLRTAPAPIEPVSAPVEPLPVPVEPAPAAVSLAPPPPPVDPAPATAYAAPPPAPAPRPEAPPRVELPPTVEIPLVVEPVTEPAASLEPVIPVEPEALPVSLPAMPTPAEPVPIVESALVNEPAVEAARTFSLDSLPPEEQELHRRAYRVAKVSMQDIKLLRPEEVRLGRENKDLCFRLRDDIEKAHKEYDRRFQSIQSHPVDYFYDWLVEILGGGDPKAVGEYPYPTSAMRR